MREEFIYTMLRLIKGFSGVFYRFDIGWVHTPPADPWRQLTDRYGPHGFKKALIRDLETRRDRYCFGVEPATESFLAPVLG